MQLTAVDHPSEVDVWTNEKVGPPTMAQPRLFTASQPVWPLAAVMATVAMYSNACEIAMASLFKRFSIKCARRREPHFIELTFDPKQLALRNDLRLVLTGGLSDRHFFKHWYFAELDASFPR